MARALIIVDVQNDFCEGGSLSVPGGAAVARAIAEYVQQADYDLVVATKDFHIDPGDHFDQWPVHCVAGSYGSQLHPDLDVALAAVFHKGQDSAAYSGFEGFTQAGHGLGDWLAAQQVDAVDIVGLATDYCVAATALDAVEWGLATRVLLGLTAGIGQQSVSRALGAMRGAGIELVGEPVLGPIEGA